MADLEQLRDKRDELNVRTKGLIEQSRDSTARVKRVRSEIAEAKGLRDGENKLVQEFKGKRDGINAKIREKITGLNTLQDEIGKLRGSMDEPIGRTKKQLEKLEWKVQTEVLNVKQEEKLAKRISELEEQVGQGEQFFEKRKELRGIASELDELKKEAQAYHEIMLQHAKVSEGYHSKIQESYKMMKKLEPDFKEVRDKITLAKREADEAHKLYIDKYKDIRGGEKAEFEKVRSTRERGMRAKESEMRKKADELFEQFKKGKKLSTDELQIIQTYSGD